MGWVTNMERVNRMKISVLSGKGGTGKTTVATNLVKVMGCKYADCDVEEPNGFIFFKPDILETRDVKIPCPVVNEEKCISCQKCVDICQFNALVHTNKEIMLFEKLCHGCGACSLVCPKNAISEEGRVIGKIDIGKSDDIETIRGILNVGEPMAGPIIGEIKDLLDDKTTILDCSPGTSCNVVKAIIDTDYAILVTEPTAFGLHDLKLAVELVRKMNIPLGVIVNRADKDEVLITSYCKDENIDILGIIPFEKKAAKLYSQGKFLVEEQEYKKIFENIAQRLGEVVACN